MSDYIEAIFKETSNPHCIIFIYYLFIFICIDMLDITTEMDLEQNKELLDVLYDFIMKCVNKLYPTGSAGKIQLTVNDLYVSGYIDPFLNHYKDVMEIDNLEYTNNYYIII